MDVVGDDKWDGTALVTDAAQDGAEDFGELGTDDQTGVCNRRNAHVAERKSLPERVSAAEAGGRDVTRREAKAIADRIKIAAYNAEEWLLDRLVLHYHNGHDVRDLLRAFAGLSGSIETTPTGVMVGLDPPDTPMHRQALRGLVEDLNAIGATFPGTDVPVTYQVRVHHSQLVA
jgi:hypothetical protein